MLDLLQQHTSAKAVIAVDRWIEMMTLTVRREVIRAVSEHLKPPWKAPRFELCSDIVNIHLRSNELFQMIYRYTYYSILFIQYT